MKKLLMIIGFGATALMAACGSAATATPHVSQPAASPRSGGPSASALASVTPSASASSPWINIASNDGHIHFSYPQDWSVTNCTAPPPLGTRGIRSQSAAFVFVPDGRGASSACDYTSRGPDDPQQVTGPWITVSEMYQPADAPLWGTCAETLVSQQKVTAGDGSTGTRFSYVGDGTVECTGANGSQEPYTGPPLGYLTVYEFEAPASVPSAYVVVIDQETVVSPDERAAVERLVTQTLEMR